MGCTTSQKEKEDFKGDSSNNGLDNEYDGSPGRRRKHVTPSPSDQTYGNGTYSAADRIDDSADVVVQQPRFRTGGDGDAAVTADVESDIDGKGCVRDPELVEQLQSSKALELHGLDQRSEVLTVESHAGKEGMSHVTRLSPGKEKDVQQELENLRNSAMRSGINVRLSNRDDDNTNVQLRSDRTVNISGEDDSLLQRPDLNDRDEAQLEITSTEEPEFLNRLASAEIQNSLIREDTERLSSKVQQLEADLSQVFAMNSAIQARYRESESEVKMLQTELSGMHEKLRAEQQEKKESHEEKLFQEHVGEEQSGALAKRNAALQSDNILLQEQLSDLRKRLESQARQQVEHSGVSESLCDHRRSSELARRFDDLYNDSVLQLLDWLDQLDSLAEWTEDDLNEIALEIFKECDAVAVKYVERQVLDVAGFLGCKAIKSHGVRDAVCKAVSLVLGESKDNRVIDISPMKQEVLRFISAQYTRFYNETVEDHVTPFVLDCLDFLLDVKCQITPFCFEWDAGVQFQGEKHKRYHASSSSGTRVKKYVWPAFVDGSVYSVLCKGLVVT